MWYLDCYGKWLGKNKAYACNDGFTFYSCTPLQLKSFAVIKKKVGFYVKKFYPGCVNLGSAANTRVKLYWNSSPLQRIFGKIIATKISSKLASVKDYPNI